VERVDAEECGDDGALPAAACGFSKEEKEQKSIR